MLIPKSCNQADFAITQLERGSLWPSWTLRLPFTPQVLESGGRDDAWQYFSELWVLHNLTETPVWEQLIPSPEARYGHSCAALGGSLFVREGLGSTTPGRLLKYNVAAREWSIVDVQGDAPTTTYGNSMVQVRDFLWWYGDQGLWVLSPEQRTWRDVGGQVRGASPLRRRYHGCTAVDDRLYVFGGFSGDGGLQVLNDMWVLDAVEGRLRPEAELVWTELSAHLLDRDGLSAPSPRYGVGLAAVGGRMYIFGGREFGKRLP